VPAGTVLVGVAPSRSWELVEPDGHVQRSEQIFGYAAAFDVARPGAVTVRFRGSWVHGLEVAVEVLLWLVVVGALVVRRRSLERLWGRARRRRARRTGPDTATPSVRTEVDDDVAEAAPPDAGVTTGVVPT
jgi:hypothetical protein